VSYIHSLDNEITANVPAIILAIFLIRVYSQLYQDLTNKEHIILILI